MDTPRSALALLFLLLASAPAHDAAADLDVDLFSRSSVAVPYSVRSICARTRNANLCVHALHPYAAAAGPSCNANWVLGTLIQAMRKHTQHAAAMAGVEATSANLNGALSNALKGCADDDCVGELDAAEKRLAGRDWAGLEIELSAAIRGYSYCDDEFVGIKMAGSALARNNKRLKDLARIALDLAQLVK